jgi:hypothetical protein
VVRGAGGLAVEALDGTHMGFLYHDSTPGAAGGLGLVASNGSWRVRAHNGGVQLYNEVYADGALSAANLDARGGALTLGNLGLRTVGDWIYQTRHGTDYNGGGIALGNLWVQGTAYLRGVVENAYGHALAPIVVQQGGTFPTAPAADGTLLCIV